MDHLIAIIFHKEEDCARWDCWLNVIEEYRLAMKIVRKRSDDSDKDIEAFQSLIDSFFNKYLSETLVEEITNYIYMLASRHIKCYVQLHRNLYKYPSKAGSPWILSTNKYFLGIHNMEEIMGWELKIMSKHTCV